MTTEYAKERLLQELMAENQRLWRELHEAREGLEQALRESEQRMQMALEVSRSYTFEWDPSTDRVLRSNSCATVLGLSGDEARHDTAQRYFQRVHPDDRDRFLRILSELKPGADSYRTEYRVIRGDDVTVVLEETGRGFFDGEGKLCRVVGVATDMTERKRAEESEERLMALMRHNPSLVFLKDEDGRYVYLNEAYERGFVRAKDWYGKTDFDFWPKESAALFRASDTEVLASGKVKQFLEDSIGPDGKRYCWLCYKFPFTDSRGRRYLGGIGIDATARVEAEEQLQRNHDTFRQLIENDPMGVYVVDADSKMRYASLGARRAFCNVPLPLIGRDFSECVRTMWDDPFASEVIRRFRHTLDTGEPYLSASTVERRRDIGEIEAYDWRIERITLPDGRFGVVCYYYDLSEQRKAEQAVRESERLYRAIGESIEYGVWVCDPEGRNIYASDSFLRLVGLTQQQCSEFGWGDVLHPDDADRTIAAWKECVRSGGTWDIEHRFRGVDGQWHPILARGVPVRNEQGQTVCWAGINLDIGRLKRAEQELVQAKATAEAANVAKSQFLANMSHELRTPMNAIMGMTELALAERLSPMVRDCLVTAKESADALLEMLNQVLDFSRIEAGRLQLHCQEFGLRDLLDKTLKPQGLRAYQKGLELTGDVPSDVPDRVVGDPLALRQILTNLVGNAIKFTEKGDVVVRVGLLEMTDEEVFLKFSVSDTGMGISPEDQEKVFEPFMQADASLTRQYGGTGLGLAISSSLVNMMGGRMWLESSIGSGSVFHFTVRLERLRAGAEESGFARAEATWLRDVPVLVVEENAASRHALERMLAGWAMKPEVVADVPAALTRLQQSAAAEQPIPLVIASAVLPGIDGISLAEWIKNNPRLAGAVILMLSAVDRQAKAKRLRDLNAICLEKPVSQAGMLVAVARALRGDAGVPARMAEPDTEGSTPPAARPLWVLLAEDNPANQKLATFVLRSRGHTVEVAGNGEQALELLTKQDFDVVLMDVQMPVVDGFQATAAIRKLEDPQKARLPIIALTAHAMETDRERCLGAGMDAYLSKPIKGEELIEIVERWGNREKREPCAPLEPKG